MWITTYIKKNIQTIPPCPNFGRTDKSTPIYNSIHLCYKATEAPEIKRKVTVIDNNNRSKATKTWLDIKTYIFLL